MRALKFITGHVIYNLAYTYKFQLKTTKDGRRWKIGPLESIGEENGEIESNPLGSELEHPFNMPYDIMDWNYYTEDGWMRSTGNDEIIVECIGEEDRKTKGKLIDMSNTYFHEK